MALGQQEQRPTECAPESPSTSPCVYSGDISVTVRWGLCGPAALPLYRSSVTTLGASDSPSLRPSTSWAFLSVSLPSPSPPWSQEWEVGAVPGCAEWACVLDSGTSMGVETHAEVQ